MSCSTELNASDGNTQWTQWGKCTCLPIAKFTVA